MIDALKIGVIIQLTNLVSSELKVIVRDMLGLDAATMRAVRSMGGFRTAVAGLGSMVVGGALLGFLGEMTKKGSELEKQLGLAQIQMASLTGTDIDRLRHSAMVAAAGSSGGFTAADWMVSHNEGMTIFKNPAEAEAMATSLTNMKQTMAIALPGASHEEVDTQVKAILKAAEIQGQTVNPATHAFDPARLDAALQFATRALLSSQGMLKGNDLLNAVKQGATVGRGVSWEKFVESITGVAQVMGGARTGTALDAYGRQFLGGKMTSANADALIASGVMRPGGYSKRKGGGIDVHDNAYFDKDLINDPVAFAKATHARVHADYMRHHAAGQTEDQFDTQWLYKNIGVGTNRRFFNEVFQNPVQLGKEAEGIHQTQSPAEAIKTAMRTDLIKDLGRLGTAFNGLWEVLGNSMVGPAIDLVNSLTAAVSGLTKAAIAHPTAVKLILTFIGVVGGLMVVLGGIAVVVGTIAVLALLPTVLTGILAVAVPVIAVLAGIAAAILVITQFSTRWDRVRATWEAQTTELDAWLARARTATRAGLASAMAAVDNSAIVQWVQRQSTALHDAMVAALQPVIDFLAPYWHRVADPIIAGVTDIGTRLVAAIGALWDTISGAFDGFLDHFRGWGERLRNLLPNLTPGGPTASDGSPVVGYPQPMAYHPPRARAMQPIHIRFDMDSRQVAARVVHAMAEQADRPDSGSTGFNPRFAPHRGGLIPA